MKGMRLGLLVAVALAMVLGLTAPAQAALVGWWKMDETSWTGGVDEVVDSSGSNNDGTAVGGATTTDDGRDAFWGRQGSFDGSNDYIDVGNDTNFDFGSAATMAMWIKGVENPAGDGYLINKGWKSGEIGTEQPFEVMYVAGGTPRRIYVKVHDTASVTTHLITTDQVAADTWTHIAVVKDSTNLAIWFDGVLSISTAHTNNIAVNTANVWIGGRNANGALYADTSLDGLLDDVRLYDNALSGSEIQGIMAIPEPSSMLLLGTGLLTLTFLVRRKKG